MAAAPDGVCRYCGDALDALTLRRGADVCGAALCRHKAARAHTDRIRDALRIAAPDAASARLPHLGREPAVVFLQHCAPEIVAVDDGDRERHRAYLESVVAEGTVIDRSRLAPSSADDTHPQGARLCAQCRGRCCEHGAAWRAFLDVTVLERWRDEEPSRTLSGAVDAYLDMLPQEHVKDACLYQTAAGCAMPRERRAEICNGFACEPLEEVQKLAASDPTRAVVAITFYKNEVERAAVIEAAATHVLPLESYRRV